MGLLQMQSTYSVRSWHTICLR